MGAATTTPRPTQAVTLNFDVVADGKSVRCGTAVVRPGHGQCVEAQPKDLRFYVSSVKLLKADGSEHAVTLGAE